MKRGLGLFLIIFWANINLFAQNCPNRPAGYAAGGFTLSSPLCVNTSATVTSFGGLTAQKYVFDYKLPTDLTTAATTTTHTYAAAGIYLVVQTAKRGTQDTWACNRVQVRATPQPDFDVTMPCGNAIVFVKLKTNTAVLYNSYTIDWGDGSTTIFTNKNTTQTHLYKDNTTYTIKMSGSFIPANCGASISHTVTPQGTAVQPTFTKAEVIDNQTVELTYTNPANKVFDLYQSRNNNANYAKIVAIPSQTGGIYKYKITNLLVNSFSYSFQLRTSLACGTIVLPVRSNEIGTVPLIINQIPYQNTLSWRPYPITADLKQYQVFRDGVMISTNPIAANPVYIDKNATCGQEVKYQIVTVSKTTNLPISYSLLTKVTTLPNIAATKLTDFVVSVENDHPVVTINDVITSPKPTAYLFYRQNGKIFDNVKSSTTKSYTDTPISASTASICYKVSYQNICNKTAELSDSVCTIFAKNDNSENLNWTTPLPFSGTLKGYSVEKIDANETTLKTYNANTAHAWAIDNQDPDQEVTFRISAKSNNNRTSLSNVIKVLKPMKIFMPNAFTPNGDAYNSKLELKGFYIKTARIAIYDRVGTVIFSSDDFQTKGWDGTMNDGTPADTGTYYFVLETTDTKGNSVSRSGNLMILK